MENHLLDELNKFVAERDWDQFHTPKNLSMALTKETAEIMEIFQWMNEKESLEISPDKILALKHEIGDVFIYLTLLAAKFNIDPLEAAFEKLKLNIEKYPAETVRGQAKKYNEY
jgi:NTP pyrophosphatase (non-canonical NTP hydrolase)